MKVKSESEVAQLCPTLSDPMDCSLPGSSINGIFQARALEWGAIAISPSRSQPVDKRWGLLTQERDSAVGEETSLYGGSALCGHKNSVLQDTPKMS